MKPLVRVGLVVAGAAAAVFACRAPTEVTASFIYTGTGACSIVTDVAISVRSDSQAAEADISAHVYNARSLDCANGQFGTLVVIPSDGADHAAITAVTGVGVPTTDCTKENAYAHCIVARRVITFSSHTSLTLPITLDADCEGVPCDAVSTCRRSQCVSSASSCADDGSCVLAVEADADAGGSDGAIPDGTGPAEMDGGDAGEADDDDGAPPPLTDACASNAPLVCPGSQTACADQCVHDPGLSPAWMCVANGTGNFHATCIGDENCPMGQHCCAKNGNTQSSCAPSCDGAQQLCTPACRSCAPGTTCKSGNFDTTQCQIP